MLITTSICSNYFPKVMALATSLKKHNPDYKFLVCLTEKEIPQVAKDYKDFDYIVLSKDLGAADFHKFIFTHSIVEASTAVKGMLFQYMLKKFPKEDKFVYLDPDIFVYDKFTALEQAMDRHNIVLIPHLLVPGNIDMEISSLKHGVYNLGFLAITRSAEAEKCINWWKERLDKYCYDDIPNGIFTDQRWIDLVPSFFAAHIFKHAGYNYATWSVKTAHIKKEKNNYTVNGDTLTFIHFSGFDSGTIDWVIRDWIGENKDDPFIRFYQDYTALQKKLDVNKSISSIKWSYGKFASGEDITNETRKIFRTELSDGFPGDPFSYSNKKIREMADSRKPNSLKHRLKRNLVKLKNLFN